MVTETAAPSFFMDKEELKRLVAEHNARMGFAPDANATAEQAQELMRAQGMRPEDNIGSCSIIAAREAK